MMETEAMSEKSGRCGTCRHRDVDGCCQNEHLHEDDYGRHPVENDCLIYSYYESGSFWVGENFGCVHWSQDEDH